MMARKKRQRDGKLRSGGTVRIITVGFLLLMVLNALHCFSPDIAIAVGCFAIIYLTAATWWALYVLIARNGGANND